MGYFEKETDAHRISEIPAAFQSALGEHREALMIGSEYGPQLMYQVPVLSLGNSIPYSNQTLWLRLDLPELRETKSDAVDKTTWLIRKRCGEPGILLPSTPKYLKYLSDARKAVVKENLGWLQSNSKRLQQIANYHRHYTYPYIENLEPEAALYQIGFFPRADEKLFKNFQDATLEEKERIVDRLTNKDARTLAIRLLCRNYPERISKNLTEEFKAYMRRLDPVRQEQAMLDYKGEPRLTPSGALAEIKRLKKTAHLDKNQAKLLDDLQNYIESKFPKRMAGRQLSFGDRF